MKGYGLSLQDTSPRPKCTCCTTKYHGAFRNDRHEPTKDRCRRTKRKSARQTSRKILREEQ